jgi:uncharacterized protein YodC (DUF2158 family)
MSDAKFDVGDTVILKSSTIEMTVKRLIEDKKYFFYECVWFAGKKVEHAIFPEPVLKCKQEVNDENAN